MRHVHKDTKDLVSVIITLDTNISGGDTVFYDRVKKSDLVNISHVLKHLHERIIFVPLNLFQEVYLWRLHRAVISLTL